MKWFRLLLAMFLLVGMLLSVSSVAYADGGEDANPPEGEEDNPGDSPGLNVDIAVIGDNPNVEVDVVGEDAEVTVNTTGTEVWINGQNLNEPTVIHQGGGVGGSWVKKRISQALEPLHSWVNDAEAKIVLTAEGLAKVILKTYGYDDDLSDISGDLARHDEELDIQKARLASLEAREAGHYAALLTYATALQQDYNRKLATIVGAFSLVVIGLIIGLVIVARRTRISA